MMAILKFLKCARVRSPHPPGNIYLDPIIIRREKNCIQDFESKSKTGFFCQFLSYRNVDYKLV